MIFSTAIIQVKIVILIICYDSLFTIILKLSALYMRKAVTRVTASAKYILSA